MLTDKQKQEVLGLLWDSMKKDPEHPTERVRTGWGTKTQQGLLACIDRILEGETNAQLYGD